MHLVAVGAMDTSTSVDRRLDVRMYGVNGIQPQLDIGTVGIRGIVTGVT